LIQNVAAKKAGLDHPVGFAGSGPSLFLYAADCDSGEPAQIGTSYDS